jgi:asparagine synthase (glutamine-hydrolysing)
MSGICGILSLDGQPPPLDLLDRMMRAMERLGPDGSDRWHDDSIGLGQQMMHITPESLGEQLPAYHPESRIALTADARLDAREDLLRTLDLCGSREIPDSQLILKAYQKWGKDCANRLVGEFAFAIWDARERSLLCVTDPMGVRPLFYRETPGKYFAFASEVEALMTVEPGHNPLDQTRLAMLGVSNLSVYLKPEATCFENIYRVPAASVLSVSGGRKTCREYWAPDPDRRLQFRSDDECRDAFQEVFFKAVKARLRSAFPVASLLSGGLDSSAIVSVASKLQKENNRSLITLSSVPMRGAQGRVTDEREFIDLFRSWENLDMRDVSAEGCGPFDDLENLVKTASLCSYSYQHFLYTAFVRTAKDNHARVILDGDGGELSASAYTRGYLAELLLAGHWRVLRKEFALAAAARSSRLAVLKGQILRPLLPYRVLKLLNRHRRFDDLLHYAIRIDWIQRVLGPEADRLEEDIFRLAIEHPDHRRNMAHDMLLEQRDIRQRSHAGFVGYQDAQFSYPFLDKRVLEFGLAVDGRFKYRDGRGRRLLRLGMRGLLPDEILLRNSKAPLSPDYHLRYGAQKDRAFRRLKAFSAAGKFDEIVDFKKVFEALEADPAYRAESPMRVDRHAQFTVPYALYLCYFLASFGD